MNFLNILLNSVKAKITPLWTKLRMLTNMNYLRTKVSTKVRTFFTKTLSLKPRHKKDYYSVGNWLVSKKLCFSVLLVIGVLSLYYLIFVNPIFNFGAGDGIKTYKYNSIPLRFVKNTVRIKAKSDYIAYVGQVENGMVKGTGSLYAKDGHLVYSGAFDNSKYNGEGKLYFDTSQLKYNGEFVDNEFEGVGTLYRENGSKEYVGEFAASMKEGEGILYDTANNEVYKGTWTKDQLIYQEMLGKSTAEVGNMYTGQRTIYRGDGDFIVKMPDINALYAAKSNAELLNDEIMVDSVYVMNGSILINGKWCSNIAQLNDALGDCFYEGNTAVYLAEAVAINAMNEKNITLLGVVDLTATHVYRDVVNVEDYDSDYIIYIYTYKHDGLLYTFYCSEKYGSFAMYMIEQG